MRIPLDDLRPRKPILFRFYDSDKQKDELLVLGQIDTVFRNDVGEEDETLGVFVGGRLYLTDNPDTIERFFNEWEIR